MSYYHPDQEPRSERLFLVTHETSRDYGHITARVLRYAKAHVEEEGKKTEYNDGAVVTGYRNATWSKSTKTGLYVPDMVVRCQLSCQPSTAVFEGRPYGHEVRYYNVYYIDRVAAGHFKRTLDTIYNKLDKMDSTNDYAEFLKRVAGILGITRFVRYADPHNMSGSLALQEKFVEFGMDEVSNVVENMIDIINPGRTP